MADDNTSKWQRTFEVGVPVGRLWRAFRDEGEYGALLAWPDSPRTDDDRRKPVLEADEPRWLKFESTNEALGERAEFTVAFESTQTGSRFTVTRYGFGEDDERFDVFAESNFLGFSHGFMDLVFYLETGRAARRHSEDGALSSTVMMYRERDWGVEVVRVEPGTFAEEAGLATGDRLLRIANVPIYTRNDIWGLVTEHGPGTELQVAYVRDGERRRGQGRLSPTQLAACGE